MIYEELKFSRSVAAQARWDVLLLQVLQEEQKTLQGDDAPSSDPFNGMRFLELFHFVAQNLSQRVKETREKVVGAMRLQTMEELARKYTTQSGPPCSFVNISFL